MMSAPNAPGTKESGLVLIDKPAGWTSHDVVARTRKLAGTRKTGHAGTLDPMATGLLVVGINKATRLLNYITGADKTYTATIRLGQTTTTDDAEGEVTQTRYANAVTDDAIDEAVEKLTGEIMQVPSTVSAIKIDGQRAYKLARDGKKVEIPARPVTIYRFEVGEIRREDVGRRIDVDVEVSCSSGTYIRALARDLGETLGVGGHLTALRRTQVGPYNIDSTFTLDELGEDFSFIELSAASAMLLPVREISDAEAEQLCYGRRLTPTGSHEIHAAITRAGQVIAMVVDKDHTPKGSSTPVRGAKPELVFVTDPAQIWRV